MRTENIVFVLSAVFVLVCASMLGERFQHRTPQEPPGTAARVPPKADLVVCLYSALGIAGFAWFAWEVVRVLGPSAFLDGGTIRAALSRKVIPSEYLFLEYFCVAAPLVALALARTGSKLRPGSWIAVAVCVLCTWLTTDRTHFFLVVLGGFFVYVYAAASRLSWLGLFKAVGVSAVLLAVNFLAIGHWVGKTPDALGVRIIATGRGSGSPFAFGNSRIARVLQRGATLYLYSTASYAALDQLLDDPERPSTGGVQTIYPIARLLERARLIAGPLPPAIPEFTPLNLEAGNDISFNGYTFIYTPLTDFGKVGAIVYAAAIGLLCGLAYGALRRRPESPPRLLLMSQVGTALALSVFVNKFNNTASWFILVITLVPFAVTTIRNPKS